MEYCGHDHTAQSFPQGADIMTWRSNVATLRSNVSSSQRAPSSRRTPPRHNVPEAMTFSILFLHRGEHFLCLNECLRCDIPVLHYDVPEYRTQQLLFSFNSSINLLDFQYKTIDFMLSITQRREATSRL